MVSINSFDAQRGNLTSRTNSAFNWSENFGYDNQDRLTSFNDNNGSHSQSYDARGRITENGLGQYGYANNTSYQHTEINNLTSDAQAYYADYRLQQVSYNALKQPVQISVPGAPLPMGRAGETINYQYNGALERSHMYYGDDNADKDQRPMRRHYSEDGGMEITENITAGQTDFVFYLTGDAYDAPAIYKETANQQTNQTTSQLYYLHRDHLGSIVMITNQDGNVVEKRQFDACRVPTILLWRGILLN